VTLQAAAASAVAEIGLLEGDHADLAASLIGGGAEDAVPPLLLSGEEGNAVFDAELAAAVLEAPAGFVADDEGTAGAGEGEVGGAEASIAEAAASAGQSLEDDDDGAGQHGEGDSQPCEGVERMLDEGDAETEQGAAAEQDGKEPGGTIEKREEARSEGAEDTDQKPAETGGEGADEGSEKLCRDPEENKSE
jgi:hypothetical protein